MPPLRTAALFCITMGSMLILFQIIKKVKNVKAPGFDGVPNILLKHASVISIPKSGKDHSNPSIYRPISRKSSVSKISEKIILKLLQNFVSDNQFGFKMAHSTSHQLGRVEQHVKEQRDLLMPESTGMLLLHVKKAFVSVWHETLMYELLMKGWM
jgi:hypothetical protein